MFKRILAIVIVLLWSGLAFAAHPPISDDTGTQGKGKFQLEVNSEFTYEKNGSTMRTRINGRQRKRLEANWQRYSLTA